MTEAAGRFVRAVSLDELQAKGHVSAAINGHALAFFYHQNRVYAVDNRCPHMGFPLDRGTVCDGILTCHWHHARFDLASGGTFDQWADDVRSFPVEVRNGDVWVDLTPRQDPVEHQRERLAVGLERDISLVLGKAVLTLLDSNGDAGEPFRAGLDFGARYRENGWGQGLTIHTCMMNLLPFLGPAERPRALFHGLSAVARDTAGHAPRFPVRPLPGATPDFVTLKSWFRQFIEVRDDEGAERCVVSALRAGASQGQIADLLFAAATDHRYIDVGHPLDFTNKALEALDSGGWEQAEIVLTSLVRGYAMAARMEEANAWRYPVDLVKILETTFERLPSITSTAGPTPGEWGGRDELVRVLSGEDPQAIADGLLAALADGCTPEQLAQSVAYAAALRIARFHTSNEFGDWDTALHTFTFANAVHQGLRRVSSRELLRGVFDAAMSVYLDRFLAMPAARIPEPEANSRKGEALDTLPTLLDRQQQVTAAAQQVANFLQGGGDASQLMAVIGRLLLREDRDFHTIQCVEAAFRQHALAQDATMQTHFLIAAIRYLAAHAPTVRSQGQTYQIALRLHRGEALFEG